MLGVARSLTARTFWAVEWPGAHPQQSIFRGLPSSVSSVGAFPSFSRISPGHDFIHLQNKEMVQSALCARGHSGVQAACGACSAVCAVRALHPHRAALQLPPLLQPREKGRMRFHRLQNVQIALDFLKQRQVRLHGGLGVMGGFQVLQQQPWGLCAPLLRL